ncbi:hypothetical protein GOP47_0016922 [Adiantum capillus-veneris]|uniref:peroxidase n=1 Tax=Adiantum capillus-veneris TaxID=13818 RepID=A0A9D4UJA3_ADICA|nr:hypothetical protein GOP47_0016922 [Adiantum capillus-veneris]
MAELTWEPPPPPPFPQYCNEQSCTPSQHSIIQRSPHSNNKTLPLFTDWASCSTCHRLSISWQDITNHQPLHFTLSLTTKHLTVMLHYPPSIMSIITRFILFVVIALAMRTHTQDVQACTVGFYKKTCPKAEAIVRTVVSKAISRDRGLGAGLLRLHFHDCFVQGCDGSVLLDSTPSTKAEKDSAPNLSLRGFEVIDEAKLQLEASCPNVVSCADIVAFAARDSVHLLGGPFWQVPAGRRDGMVSDASLALSNLPAPFFNVKQLTHSFGLKGLTQDDMVTLSGAHTVGVAHCSSFQRRLYNFSSTSALDPTLDEELVEQLKQVCPPPRLDSRIGADPSVNLDLRTPSMFDNAYYYNIELGQGLLQSDEALYSDPVTSKTIKSHAYSQQSWSNKFKLAMIKMSLIEVKTEDAGEIRANCHVINSNY